MRPLELALAAYYDQEAAGRQERQLEPRRLSSRGQFAALLADEGRSELVEVGTGPGVDAVHFAQQGLVVRGVDVSPVAVELARASGVDAQVGTVLDLPFASATFDALWTMSTLLHVPNADIDRALQEMIRVCRPGAPLVIGVWAGEDTEGLSDFDELKPPRFFSFRSEQRMAKIVSAHGSIEDFQVWSPTDTGHLTYNRIQLRAPSR